MAEKTVILNLNIDASQSVEELQLVEDSLKGVEDSLKKIGAGGTGKLEDQLKAMNKLTKENKLNWGEMGKAIEQYQNIALAAGSTSPIGKEALARAAEMKREVDEVTKSVDALSKKGQGLQTALQLGGSVVGGFAAVQGITALLGEENEEAAKAVMKFQAAQSALMGIEQLRASLEQGSLLRKKADIILTNTQSAVTAVYTAAVGTSTGALKLFRLALISTGIGALIVGLGLLIANFDTVSGAINSAGQAILEFFGIIDRQAVESESALKKQTSALREQTQQRLDDIDDIRAKEAEAHSQRQTAFDLEIARNEAIGKSSRQLMLAKEEDLLEEKRAILASNEEKIQIWIDYYKNLALLRGESEEEFIESMRQQGIDLREGLEIANQSLQDNRDAVFSAETDLLKLKNKFRDEDRNAAAQANKDKEQALRDQLALEKKLFEEYFAWQKAEQKRQEDLRIELAKNYKELLQEEIEVDEDFELIPEEELDSALEKIGGFFAQLKMFREIGSENIKAELEESLNQAKQVADQAFEALSAINGFANQLSDNRINKIQQNAKKELAVEGLTAQQKFQIELKTAEAVDKINKKKFQREKAFNIAKGTMDTASAVLKALGSAPPPANFVLAALAGGAGLAQIATISAQQFEGSVGGITPPTFNAPSNIGGEGGGSTNTSTTTGDANVGTTTNVNSLISKVVVVETDITDSVNKVAKMEEIATL